MVHFVDTLKNLQYPYNIFILNIALGGVLNETLNVCVWVDEIGAIPVPLVWNIGLC